MQELEQMIVREDRFDSTYEDLIDSRLESFYEWLQNPVSSRRVSQEIELKAGTSRRKCLKYLKKCPQRSLKILNRRQVYPNF